MKEALISKVSTAFQAKFGQLPELIVLSPGRINIIGEHVDYNDGFVLPAAIDKYACFAISESASDIASIEALDIDKNISFTLLEDARPSPEMWANYLLGVLYQMQRRNLPVRGFNVIFSSDVPLGAGLSSSAAIECGFGFALNCLFDLNISRTDIALIGQKAEHTFVGVKCGIMDQFASVFGKKDKVIKLDCMTLEREYHNGDFGNYSLLLLDSKVKHTHLTSGYNDRRRECEEGLAIIKKAYPDVKSFRDATESQVQSLHDKLGEVIFRRCIFVVREIGRVNQAVTAIESNDYKKLGSMMHQTHIGLSSEYEVSCEELDFLVSQAMGENAVIGSRMMGGGFGGCSINLVEEGREDQLIEKISARYKEKYNIDLAAYKVKISDGTFVCDDPLFSLRAASSQSRQTGESNAANDKI